MHHHNISSLSLHSVNSVGRRRMFSIAPAAGNDGRAQQTDIQTERSDFH